MKRKSIIDIKEQKGKEPIVCLTAYTAPIARAIDKYVDLLLVGDSLGMVLYDYENTLPVTLDQMIEHSKSVVGASENACVIVDMPFGTYEESINLAFNKGDLIMASGMFAWALYSALLKKKTYEISQIALLEVVIITGLIFLIPIYILEMNFGNQIIIGKPFILTLSYVVIFPGLASFFFWIKGIGIIGTNRAGVFLHLMPVFGSFMAIILFDEKFMIYHFFGAIFIIAGITFSNKKIKNNA